MLLTNQNSPGSSDGQDNLVGVNVLVGLFADLLTARLNVIGQLLYDLKHVQQSCLTLAELRLLVMVTLLKMSLAMGSLVMETLVNPSLVLGTLAALNRSVFPTDLITRGRLLLKLGLHINIICNIEFYNFPIMLI